MGAIAIFEHTIVRNIALSGCEPFRVVRTIWQDPETRNAKCDGEETFEYEEDLPVLDMWGRDVLHTKGNPGTESSCDWRSCEIDTDSLTPFLFPLVFNSVKKLGVITYSTRVHDGGQVWCPGYESCFEYSEEQPNGI